MFIGVGDDYLGLNLVNICTLLNECSTFRVSGHQFFICLRVYQWSVVILTLKLIFGSKTNNYRTDVDFEKWCLFSQFCGLLLISQGRLKPSGTDQVISLHAFGSRMLK